MDTVAQEPILDFAIPNLDRRFSGKSVDSAHWYVIRATHCRALSVYNAIVALANPDLEPYFPVYRKQQYNGNFDDPGLEVVEVPVFKGMLFLRSSVDAYRNLLRSAYRIPGLTPYYDHFRSDSSGRNDYLVVPDWQMSSFRKIVESGQDDIIVDQDEVPAFLKGDFVKVIGGPFAGVEGQVLRWKSQKRVFVQLEGVGCFGTAYIPSGLLRPIEKLHCE